MIFFHLLLASILYLALGEKDVTEEFQCNGIENEDGKSQCDSPWSVVLPDGVNVKNEIGDEECNEKAEEGYCNYDPEFMLSNCIPACLEVDDLLSEGFFLDDAKDEVCEDGEPVEWDSEYELKQDYDIDEVDLDCENDSLSGDCMINPRLMMEHCAKSCMFCIHPEEETFPIGEPQIVTDLDLFHETIQVMKDTLSYMQNEVMMEDEYWPVRKYCRNRHELCSEWAAQGHCENDNDWRDILHMCGPACQACEMFDIRNRCPHDESTNIFKPGDLDKMFETIIGEREKDPAVSFPEYTATVHSRPKTSIEGNEDEIDGPWIVTLENFLTDEECDHLTKTAPDQGFLDSTIGEGDFSEYNEDDDSEYDESENIDSENEVSEDDKSEDEDNDEGDVDGDGDGNGDNESEEEGSEELYRTSSTAWCDDKCFEDPIIRTVIQKIENITGVPSDYSEYLQFLQYIPGQYYKTHHDNNPTAYHSPSGARILTVFLYLNDVEEGGETKFNDIGNGRSLIVKPKRGLALIWPSVLDKDLSRAETRTFHEAMIVNKGVKYGVNAWLRLRSWHNHSCSI